MSRKKLLSLMLSCSLAATTVFSNFGWSSTNVNVRAAETETETVVDETQVDADSYGLCKNIQDGVILHCFDWKYSDIEAELPNIAKAGFTAVQTSPAQRNDSGGDPWYMMYQPQNFAISSNPIGGKAELESLCKKADEYGIKIIVDVVANHTRGMDGNNGPVDDNLKRAEFYRWNNKNSNEVNWQNRSEVYTCNIGMRDLVSENADLQKIIAGYISELQGVGVDGIRWDAAKHIQLPSEGSEFWKKVTEQGLWHYGEILDGPNNGGANNDNYMKEYTNYISVTDDMYGKVVLEGKDGSPAFTNERVPNSIGNYSERGVAKNKLIYWAESHDTYANDGEYGSNTSTINQNIVDRAYAIVAAQGKATSLYFSRPYETRKASIKPGVKGSTHFTSKEVAAVNHLHNSCVGQKDYYVHSNDNSVAAVCRETGAVIVKGKGSGQVSIQNGGGLTKPGTYTDEVSGSTWTVTKDTISGNVGETGIAVIYDGSVTGGGDSETTEPTKTNPPSGDTNTNAEANTIVATMPSGWSDLYIYAYEPGATVKKLTGEWPGTKMTAGSDGKYTYKMDASVKSAKVIFASGPSGSQDPVDVEGQTCGYDYVGGKAYSYSGGTWSEVTIATATKEPEKTKEPTKEPTKTEEPKKTEQPTEEPKVTDTPKVTQTATVTPTQTPKVTATVKPTATPKVTATVKPTGTPKVTATVKPTATAPSQSMSPNYVPDNSVTTPGAVYYKITYQINGGYFAVGVPSNYTGDEDITLRIPVREGYTFAGWYTDSAYNQKISVIKAGTKGDITVYAKWKRVSKPGKPVIATIKKSNSKKKIQVVLKKKVSGAYGYEAVIAKNAKFTKGRRVIRFRTLSKQITKLKAGTYYVKVRAYKVDSAGERIYGSYCVKPKKVVLKK